jgi:hypothetical protein
MNHSSQPGVLSLDEARRAKHAALFLAATMTGGQGQCLHRLGCPVSHLRYFRQPDVDDRHRPRCGTSPKAHRDMGAPAPVTCMCGKLWEREPFAELSVDTYVEDGAGRSPG